MSFLSSPIELLKSSQRLYASGYSVEGHQKFQEAILKKPEYEGKVYEYLWKEKGSPSGIPEFGRWSFHGLYGYSSTSLEKAHAMYSYISDLRRIHDRHDSLTVEHYNSNGTLHHKSKSKCPILSPDDPDYLAKIAGMSFAAVVSAIIVCVARIFSRR